jgi:hypothetical protein
VQPVPLLLLLIGTVLGWGLVTNTYAGWLNWQGYLFDLFGVAADSSWRFANLGVLAAFLVGFLGIFLRRSAVRRQEAA